MKKGYCHICRKYSDLTFEHIPPQKAFNYNRAKSIEGDSFLKIITDNNRMPWELNDLKYVSKQRGMGMYSLCSNCNNIMGTFYGDVYIKFAYTIHNIFPEILQIINDTKMNIANFKVQGINPLLFAKQVLSMFCSTCEHITQNDPNIKDLLLNKDQKGLDTNKYRLSMFLMNQRKIAYSGYQVMLIGGIGIIEVATIDAYPFGFVLEFNPRLDIKRQELDITSFFNDYDCKNYNLEFGIPVLERNNIISCDYRSKNEIKKCIEKNKKIKI